MGLNNVMPLGFDEIQDSIETINMLAAELLRTYDLIEFPAIRKNVLYEYAGADDIDGAGVRPDVGYLAVIPCGLASRVDTVDFPVVPGATPWQLPSPRAGAARYLSLLSGGRPVNADNVLVSNNEQQALFNVCFALFSVGDEVLIAAPSRASYPGLLYIANMVG